ncbi:hypothetical protein Tco_1091009 [Tanacetum coccineum]|uniref:Uncharacterized protein n=1 Tax=Tanacetum coccineum TaxID=301880 RepID=A0ABQ5I5T4_9ASTR
MDKKISTLWNASLRIQEELDNNHQAHNKLPKRLIGMWSKLTPLGLVKEKSMLEPLKLCTSDMFHHYGSCTVKMRKTRKMARNQGHYKSDCPKLKNRNLGKPKLGGSGTMEWCFAFRREEKPIKTLTTFEDEIEA